MSSEREERAAAAAAGLDYDALCMASMIADSIRGQRPALHELPYSARRLVTAYLAARDGFPGAYDRAAGRNLQVLPAIERRGYGLPGEQIIEGEIIEGGDD